VNYGGRIVRTQGEHKKGRGGGRAALIGVKIKREEGKKCLGVGIKKRKKESGKCEKVNEHIG